MAVVGNTVLLKGSFPSDIGDLSLLTNVKVKIYTEDLKLIQDLGTPTKTSDGNYEIRYTVTSKLMPDTILYEFSAQLGVNTYIGRQQLNRTYV